MYMACRYVVKTKALISCAVTAQLICTFVFTKSKFSHEVAHFIHRHCDRLQTAVTKSMRVFADT